MLLLVIKQIKQENRIKWWESIFWEGGQEGFPGKVLCKEMNDEKEQTTWRYEWMMFQEGASVSEKPWDGNEIGIHETERRLVSLEWSEGGKLMREEVEWMNVNYKKS